MDRNEYESCLKKAYENHAIATKGGCFFRGQLDEASEVDKEGKPLELTGEQLEDNEDDLIQLMHFRFLQGYDADFIDYNEIDNDWTLDDKKQMEQDSEDKYFDKEPEETETKEDRPSVYTGELDY